MTESEWFACTDLDQLLMFLCGRASDRKLRLFACGCCRRMWDLLTDARSRSVVEASEQYADRGLSKKKLASARAAARMAAKPSYSVDTDSFMASVAAVGSAYNKMDIKLTRTTLQVRHAMMRAGREAAFDEEQRNQIAVLHCIFGNPFRLVTLKPSWLTSTVTGLAETIYQERAFDRLPILADALEDAGCGAKDILQHCRQGGEHVRGCWCVDQVTERE